MAIVCAGLTWLLSSAAFAGAEPLQLPENPFVLRKSLIVPGTSFQLEIVADSPTGGDKAEPGGRFDVAQDGAVFWLRYPVTKTGGAADSEPIWLLAQVKRVDSKTVIEMRMPDLPGLPDIKTQGGGRGVIFPFEATLLAEVKRGDDPSFTVQFPVRLPAVAWAWAWGVLAVLVSLLVIGFIAVGLTKRGSSPKTIMLSPMQVATTPVGGYSLSLTQILIWTCITIFGLVYVYYLTYNFLAISTQMLVLLGIGGGTAVASKILSEDAVVARAMKLAEMNKRAPMLRDLIWSVSGADVYKFQMLVFTLLTGFIVLVEIARKYSFPDIPENLVALMGVSSSVYVGNKAVQRSESNKVRDKLKTTLETIGSRSPTDDEKKSLRGLVEQLYPS